MTLLAVHGVIWETHFGTSFKELRGKITCEMSGWRSSSMVEGSEEILDLDDWLYQVQVEVMELATLMPPRPLGGIRVPVSLKIVEEEA